MKSVPIGGLDHVGLRVADIDRALAFYARFGFMPTHRDTARALATARTASGVELNLVGGAEPRLRYPNVLVDDPVKRPGFTHVAFAVTSLVQTMSALEAAGVPIVDGPVVLGGNKRSVFVRDPDANLVELTELIAPP